MDIEFIKWLCERAEGFSYEIGSGINGIVVGKYAIFTENDIKQNAKRTFTSRLWIPIYYPLLLQRAIEGVNNTKGIFEIQQNVGDIQLYNRKTVGFIYFMLNEFKSADQAKESALEYIYEQEKK